MHTVPLPTDTEELEKLLEESSMKKETRVEIMTAVRKGVAEQIAHQAKYPDVPPRR